MFNKETAGPIEKYRSEFMERIENEIARELQNEEEEKREQTKQKAETALCDLGMELSLEKLGILKLKLIQYFKENEDINIEMLRFSITETPHFLRGSLQNLIETFRNRTSKANTENIHKRMDIEGKEDFNPYISEFETFSGKYYLARLLNRPHLEEEGDKMNHCINAPTSATSYLYRMRAGDVDTFSLREKDGHTPVVTIEYDRNKKMISQLKKRYETKITGEEPFFYDLIDALKKIQETTDETHEKRKINSIYREASEDIKMGVGNICTERGEIPFDEYDPKKDTLVLSGNIITDENTSPIELKKISRIPSVRSDLTKLSPELKHSITEWEGHIVDDSVNISYSNLECVQGYIDAQKACEFEAKKLKYVGGNMNIRNVKHIDFPVIESVGGLLSASSAESFSAVSLILVEGPIACQKAMTFETPNLKKATRIDLSKNLSDENIFLPEELKIKVMRY